jgi:hypothetical protein
MVHISLLYAYDVNTRYIGRKRTFSKEKEMRMHHVVICGISDSTVFCTLSHKQNDYRKKKVIQNKMGVLVFSTTFV